MLEHPLWQDLSKWSDDVGHSNTSTSSPTNATDQHTMAINYNVKQAFPFIKKSNRYQHKWWCRRKRRRLRCGLRLPQYKITGTISRTSRMLSANKQLECVGQLRRTRTKYLINKNLANEKDKLVTNPPSRLKRAAKEIVSTISASDKRPGRQRPLVTDNKDEMYHTYKLDIKSDKIMRETTIKKSSSSSSTTIYSSKIFTPVLLLNVLLQSWKSLFVRSTRTLSAKSLAPPPTFTLNVVLKLLLVALVVTPPSVSSALFVDSSVSIVAAPHDNSKAASLALTGSDSNNANNSPSGESSIGNLFMEKPGGSKAGGSSPNFNLESKLAAVFRKAAYGTTTKRSIPDSVFVPSLTTVPTPLLTTFRYREKEKEINLDRADFDSSVGSSNQQSSNSPHYRSGNYEIDLERDHALPTSAPNAEILKSNSNPNYPNPNRHHNHDRHRHIPNSTSAPMGHNQKKGNGVPTSPMYSGDMPSYSPPSRAFFTPPLPREFSNPFADKPTLRGTNSDGAVINTNSFINRRPIPPPSLVPGHERIPYRPPELGGAAANGKPNLENEPHNSGSSLSTATNNNQEFQRKKALNTPSQQKINKMDVNSEDNGRRLLDNANTSETPLNGILPFPSIERILSGSNERKGKIPDVLLRSVTIRPSIQQQQSSTNLYTPAVVPPASSAASNNGQEATNLNKVRDGVAGLNPTIVEKDDNNDSDDDDDDDDDLFDDTQGNPKSQPKTKKDSKLPTESSHNHHDGIIYSTQNIPSLANVNNDRSLLTTTEVANGHHNQKHFGGTGTSTGSSAATSSTSDLETWTIAWNIHVYLSAILFTILAVYSIFKMCFYDKLTHLFNQSYFVCIHLILILICLARIFYLCYDAYNIHALFHVFISEILLNLPATFLTVAFSCLILFLLIRSLNTKQNRYSALIRPLTVLVGSFVHVILCFTLHYVESYANAQQYTQYYGSGSNSRLLNNNGGSNNGGRLSPTIHPPPRVLSLICQIIYIFVCTSLGLSYLYVYRMLKRSLRSKSQNYIHGYQNLSYAIHITIATALLFLLLAALQIYGAVSISVTARPMITSPLDIDWLQWGYQFSLRLIEVAIILLLLWVTGLKTGASKVLQREKGLETHNVSGFALFPCTSSSSQEHFETDYPAVCNANTNLHTYTLRTGKPIYDDNFALNSLNLDAASAGSGGARNLHLQQQTHGSGPPSGIVGADFQLIGNSNEFTLACETNSMRSSQASERPTKPGGMERSNTIPNGPMDHEMEMDSDELNDSGAIPDHYENPNFELRSNDKHHHMKQMQHQQHGVRDDQMINDLILDNCYSEPLNSHDSGSLVGAQYETNSVGGGSNQNYSRNPQHNMHGHHHHPNQQQGYDFQNFERPNFDRPTSRNEFRASKNLKAMKNNAAQQHPQFMTTDHRNPTGPQQSGNYDSATLYGFGRNSIDRRLAGGVKKSGTLNSLAGSAGIVNGNGGGNNSSSSSSSRHSNAKTMSNMRGGGAGIPGAHHHQDFTRGSYKRDRHRSSLERKSQIHVDASGNAYAGGEQSGSSGDSATSGSMLVAEAGFVRFRALDDIGLNSSQRGGAGGGGGGIKHAVTASRTSGRSSKEKRFTNS